MALGLLEQNKSLDRSGLGLKKLQYDPFATKIGASIVGLYDFTTDRGKPSVLTAKTPPEAAINAQMANMLRDKAPATNIGIERPYVSGALQLLNGLSTQYITLADEFNFTGKTDMLVGMPVKLRPPAEWNDGTHTIFGLRQGAGDAQYQFQVRKIGGTASPQLDNVFWNTKSAGLENIGSTRASKLTDLAGHMVWGYTQFDPALGARIMLFIDRELWYESGWKANGTTIAAVTGSATIGSGNGSGTNSGRFETRGIVGCIPSLTGAAPLDIVQTWYDMNAARLLTGW
jgi:hypothetical protein